MLIHNSRCLGEGNVACQGLFRLMLLYARDVTVWRLTVDGTVNADNRLRNCSPVNDRFVSSYICDSAFLFLDVATVSLLY